jgi:hypothetical protein
MWRTMGRFAGRCQNPWTCFEDWSELPQLPVHLLAIPLSEFRQEWRAPAYQYRTSLQYAAYHHPPTDSERKFMQRPEQLAEERDWQAKFLRERRHERGA